METATARLVAQVVTNAGYEIILLRNSPASSIQVWVDREPEGVTIEDCITLTRAVWEMFEEEELDRGDFNLEIQSPGMDRPLTKPAHFERFMGAQITVRLTDKDMLGRRNFTGKLLGFVEGEIQILSEEEFSFALTAVAECRLVPVGKFNKLPPPGTRTRKPTKRKRKRPNESRKRPK
ncbi:MAG: ribosome maturation factor RimP [Planctomycetes bacterium]|nr:ribosome maturation factor RimP [Planctomycetota bacterium]